MKLRTPLVAALLIGAISLSTANAQSTLYWDINGTAPGAASAGTADGFWDTGSTPNWNPLADGTGTLTTWTAGDHAVFSAGNDVSTDPNIGALIIISGSQSASSVLIEDGYIFFISGDVNYGAGTVTILEGATLDIDSMLRFNTAVTGNVVLQGGTIKGSNPGNDEPFLRLAQTIVVDGTGIVSYGNGDATPLNKAAVYSGTITGAGGTTTNGGAGTLIKRGADRFGAQGGANQQNYTFAKLVVEQGMYQARGTSGVIHETVYGAVPLAVTPDAVTLNGGQIGANASFTTHANRGFTIGPNGGTYNGNALQGGEGNISIPGPFSGSGTFTVFGSAVSGIRLQNANNVNTFSGAVVVNGSRLFLDESLSPASLSGTGGLVEVASGKTLTVGSVGASTSYSGTIAGAGNLTKTGTGTFTMDGTKTYTGDTTVLAGTLSTNSASLANLADVYLTTGSFFNLNFEGSDTIDQLFFNNAAQASGTWGAIGSGATNETELLTGTGLLQVRLVGDYNGDNVVDAADYVLWRKDPASHGGNPQGYNEWRANFGNPPGSGSGSGLSAGAVPEPGSALLLMFGLTAVGIGRRSRR